jgi:hypothetical protein
LLVWGANFYLEENQWKYQSFKGTKWQNIRDDKKQEYLKNAYRVLLTRARQGMVILIPAGSLIDTTRCPKFYDNTWQYFKDIGVKEL